MSYAKPNKVAPTKAPKEPINPDSIEAIYPYKDYSEKNGERTLYFVIRLKGKKFFTATVDSRNQPVINTTKEDTGDKIPYNLHLLKQQHK